MDLAEELAIDRVVVPPRPGAFSAWGMLHAPLRSDGVVAVLRDLADVSDADLDAAFARVLDGLDPALVAAVEATGATTQERSLDLRYAGQKYTVNLRLDALPGVHTVRKAFDDRYQQLFGFASPRTPVEVVNARLGLVGARPVPATDVPAPEGPPAPPATATGRAAGATSVERAGLAPGATLTGPVVVTELTATTYVPAGWRAAVEHDGSLSLTRDPAAGR